MNKKCRKRNTEYTNQETEELEEFQEIELQDMPGSSLLPLIITVAMMGVIVGLLSMAVNVVR